MKKNLITQSTARKLLVFETDLKQKRDPGPTKENPLSIFNETLLLITVTMLVVPFEFDYTFRLMKLPIIITIMWVL